MSNAEPIRILLVGGYAVMRAGLRAFLGAFSELCVVGEARDAEAALRFCAASPPDIVLVDARMPGDDALARAVHAAGIRARVVALADDGDDALAQAIVQAGAIACLPKSISADELADVIRHAHHGWLTVPAGSAQLLRHPPGQALTPREREVLALMSEGLHNSAIAKRLVISPATVKFHVSSILAKLDASTRTEAVAIAVERHLASAPHHNQQPHDAT